MHADRMGVGYGTASREFDNVVAVSKVVCHVNEERIGDA